MAEPIHRWLARVVDAKPGEVRALLWSFTYFFCLLAGYYVLRPVRDEMGLAGGIKNLPWLFQRTLVVMSLAGIVLLAVSDVYMTWSRLSQCDWDLDRCCVMYWESVT